MNVLVKNILFFFEISKSSLEIGHTARYAKFIPRHTWCIKHKNRKHTLCRNSFYLRNFSKKKKSSFFGPSSSFLPGACRKFFFLVLLFFEMLSTATATTTSTATAIAIATQAFKEHHLRGLPNMIDKRRIELLIQ